MSTAIRPEISQKNPYWIPKHRYYELKHFVMQYPAWVAARKGLDFLHTPTYCVRVKKDAADPTMTGAELRAYYSDRIDMVDRASFGCGCPQYVLKGILDSLSYEKLLLKYPAFIRYTKEKYYEAYSDSGWCVLCVGGNYYSYANFGLMYFGANYDSSYSYGNIGARLLFIP